MITERGYSKDPSIMPEGIMLTLPEMFFMHRQMTTEQFKKVFERHMAQDDSWWNFKLTNLPKHDVAYVYLVFDKQVQYRCNLMQYERNVSKSFKDSADRKVRHFDNCNWDDLRNAAMDCGWALGLHGSLANDMDIMAMPWVEDAKPVEVMIKALSDCFTESIFKEHHLIPHNTKPHGRTVYTMSIWADFHLDISIMSKADLSLLFPPKQILQNI